MTEAGKDLITPSQAVLVVGNQIDDIINQCLPIAAQASQNFVQALTLANGIKALRNIILHDKHIKETITSMQNTHLGFMTDRTDLAIWKSKQQGSKKEIKPYRYEDVAEVCIEAMLKGYRITDNEFNMIAGRFYAAKNGKFRRIQEHEGLTDFTFTTTSPQYEPKSQGGKQYAKVQCFASWRMNGTMVTLGSSEKAEDRLMLKIIVNNFMGEDAIVGKALSKLFSRVLMRLEGKIMPEATDIIEDDNIVDAEIEEKTASDLDEMIKKRSPDQDNVEQKEEKPSTVPCPYCKVDIQALIDFNIKSGWDAFACPACKKDGKIEDGLPVIIPPVEADQTGSNNEEHDAVFRSEWIKLKGPGFSTYFHQNRGSFESASHKDQAEAKSKWQKFYGEPWPLDKPEPAVDLLDEIAKFSGDIRAQAEKDCDFGELDRPWNDLEMQEILDKCKELDSLSPEGAAV